MTDEEDEYCAKCGDAEFDKPSETIMMQMKCHVKNSIISKHRASLAR